LNIRLTARTWPLVTSFCLIHWKPPWWQTFRWWWRGWNGGVEVTETTVKRLICCGFDALVKRWDKCIIVGWGYVEK
jgi:hypothetical protein